MAEVKETRQTAGPGKFVRYAYKLYNVADDALLFATPKGQPDEMVFGASQEVVPGLVNAIQGLGAGDRFEVELPPAAAFGDYDPRDVLDLDREIFMRDGQLAPEVKEGAVLPMMTAEGYRVMGKVLEIGDRKVRMDLNHPFAGMTVRFAGEVTEVRDATEEDIHPTGGCGGCHGGGCGDGGCCGGEHEGDGCNGGGCGEGGCCGK